MSTTEIQNLVDDATYDFTMGEHAAALEKLSRAVNQAPDALAAWHALAEVNFHLRRFDEALQAAESALALDPEDLFINTTLSRIWMEKGDKATAEKFGAKAKILSWKDQLKNPGSQTNSLS
jgi:tetratricopeptide (TPR) repeat protein